MKRLEALLTKCKDSIKTNKQKTSALAETNRSLSEQVTDREAECERLRLQVRDNGVLICIFFSHCIGGIWSLHLNTG